MDAELKAASAESYQRITRVITKIPRGRVMTYGQVAEDAGLGRAARLVGYALRTIYVMVPWHRVLGKRSDASTTSRRSGSAPARCSSATVPPE